MSHCERCGGTIIDICPLCAIRPRSVESCVIDMTATTRMGSDEMMTAKPDGSTSDPFSVIAEAMDADLWADDDDDSDKPDDDATDLFTDNGGSD